MKLKATKIKSVSSAAGKPVQNQLKPAPLPKTEAVVPPKYAPFDPDNDPQVQAAKAAAAKAKDATLASLADRSKGLDVSFGLGENADPNNPWSKLALLQKSFQQAQRGNQTSMAARGQLSSGAYQRAQRRASDAYGQGHNDLQSAYRSGKAAIQDAVNAANAGAESADIDAVNAYLERLNALNAVVPSTTITQGGAFKPLTPAGLAEGEPTVVGQTAQKTTGKRRKKGRR